ncbi:type II toxin-antitoxin system VapC family toxin [Flavisphingomonas formosensis]|uniref:type II toxin-antitoxin system VapC family toxin n=1 Tax=Flavisphingomonas formosensis TaxID=861534 RepID=UPI0012FC3DBD|nr:type II toxin-antitoxin system VapC family toxin [Sphingomonas formosensis]
MKLLLDTHVLLWAAANSNSLSPAARTMIDKPENSLFFSAASLWEIAIKRSLDRPDFVVDPRQLRRALIDNGYEELPITGEHAASIDRLPPIHKDPFDRMLIAQALAEDLMLVTAEDMLTKYPAAIERV